SLSIMPDKQAEVEFILTNVDIKPVFIDNEAEYKKYLFDGESPVLLTDNKTHLVNYIMRVSTYTSSALDPLSIGELKDLREELIKDNRNSIVSAQIKELKSYALYSEVVDTYNEIIADSLYDVPLMLEWNTWRAMTMINGGTITGNFKIDDAGQPMSTAQGNMPDIICDYGDFDVTVEVTMQSGQRQYDTECEPVARHLGKHKKETGKETFGLFIAPRINPSSVAHFFMLSKVNVAHYGGKAMIVPLELDTFMKMIDNSYNAKYVPTPKHMRDIFEFAKKEATSAQDENQWFDAVQSFAQTWVTM
ncbi:MAG: AlwI family type II restriction endonuclease, partial [Eubacteriales bacterium]|nr:AlwI family type II restriction endonuclease [Eubacteriales bacterium]